MSIIVNEYAFDGPYLQLEMLRNEPGVFAIFCIRKNGAIFVIDVGESGSVRAGVESYTGKECWSKECGDSIAAGVLYTPELDEQGRKDIEKKIRSADYVPCGR